MTDPQFSSLDEIREVLAALPEPDAAALAEAGARNAQLTKPLGSLGRLEELAVWYAGWRGSATPGLANPQVLIFAGNHGVAAQGVSAFPPEVTVQMVANFRAGGAAVNQLARSAGAGFSVVELDLDAPTHDFTRDAAMSNAEFLSAFSAGWEAVDCDADLLVIGEMGIGNTTSAAAIVAALLGGTGWAGRGTGVDDAGLARKEAAVAAGLAANPGRTGLDVLMALGGREVAAMAGAIAGARAHRVPVILDGFICCAAALTLPSAAPVEASRIPNARETGHQSSPSWCFFMNLGVGMVESLRLALDLPFGTTWLAWLGMRGVRSR